MRPLARVVYRSALAGALGLIIVGAFPAQSSADLWSWGHNNITPGPPNDDISSGWNYFIDQYQHKHSQTDSYTEQWFQRLNDGKICYFYLTGNWISFYWTASEAGCSGYNKSRLSYFVNGSSYTYIDSWAG